MLMHTFFNGDITEEKVKYLQKYEKVTGKLVKKGH